MIELKSVEKQVRYILTEYPETRDDDMLLYSVICKKFLKETYNKTNYSFEEVMEGYKNLGLPHFESVRRTRQKIQATTPSLHSSKEVQVKRRQLITDFQYYALDLDS